MMVAEALNVGSFMVPGFVILLLLAVFFIAKAMAGRYRRIPPNEVAIIFGRGTKTVGEGQIQGCKVVSGGGVLVWPIFQDIAFMSTAVFNLPIDESNIPNKENVKITVGGFAACKISNAPEDLQAAAMSFLGQTQTQIESTVKSLLIGHVRSIIGKLSINEILRDRDAFNQQVVKETAPELKKLGIQVVSLVIQDVGDEHGYIDALGKKAVAEAVRDADITVAEAKSLSAQKVSAAEREAAVVKAKNAEAVSDAEKELAIRQASNKVAADTERAKAEKAMAIANAAQEQTLRVAEAARDAAEARAQIDVENRKAERKQAELVATTIRPAEAAREAAIIEAEGKKKSAIIGAEASKEVAVQKAEGDAKAAETLGKGQAAQTLATLNAKAEGEAAVTRQALLAKADGDAAMKGRVLLAEAEGTAKLAEALAKMTDSAKLILVLDRLAPLMTAGGDALAKVAGGIFTPVAAGLGNIDSIHITDLGGTGRGVSQMGGVVPQIVFDFVSRLSAMGVDLKGLAKKAGLNIDDLLSKIGTVTTAAAPAAEAGSTGTKE